MKKETIEETYLDNLINEANKEFTLDRKLAKEVAIKFAKWQQKQMYSDEEVEDILEHYDRDFKLDAFGYTKPCSFTVKEWFKQFKNK